MVYRKQYKRLAGRQREAFSPVSSLSVARLLVGVSVPDDVIRQAVHFFAGTLGHLCEAFGFGLVLESVGGEVDACDGRVRMTCSVCDDGVLRTFSVDVSLDNDADTSHAVERDLDVFVVTPVAHAGHVDTVGLVFLVA